MSKKKGTGEFYPMETGEKHFTNGVLIDKETLPSPHSLDPIDNIGEYVERDYTYSEPKDENTWDGGEELYAVVCARIQEDLSIMIPCMKYQGNYMRIRLTPVLNPIEVTAPLWKAQLPILESKPTNADEYRLQGAFVSEILRQGNPGCLNYNEGLEFEGIFSVLCAVYQGISLSFEMERFHHPEDPIGLYLRLRLLTLSVNAIQKR